MQIYFPITLWMAVETKFSIKCKKRNKGSSKEENDNFKRLKKLERRILKAGGINQLNAVSLNMISSVRRIFFISLC